MTFVFKWACSSKSYIITKIRMHFFKANVLHFWIIKLHMQTSDQRFKMPSNGAFKTGCNGSANLNSLERVNIILQKPLSMENTFILLSLVIRTWLRECSHFSSPEPHKLGSQSRATLSPHSYAWLRSNVFPLYLPQRQIESQSIVDSEELTHMRRNDNC